MIKHREGDIALDFISLANAMPQLVWISLADGVTIYYNDRLADYAGTKKKEDGSWMVKSRSFPSVPYVDSGFPHGDDQFISAAGSNWAIMALVLAGG